MRYFLLPKGLAESFEATERARDKGRDMLPT